jgi:hypothetical protein
MFCKDFDSTTMLLFCCQLLQRRVPGAVVSLFKTSEKAGLNSSLLYT